MKKVIYNTYGGPEVLEIIEVDAPRPSPEEVSIQVKAVSINPLDWKLRGGLMKLGPGKNLGRSIGIDFAGVVAEVGGQARGLSVGDEVFGGVKDPMKEGALAETITVRPEQLALVPDNISHEQAAAMVSVGAPALMALHDKAKLRIGDEVLIHGASGGVGMIATQVAKRAGAKVTAVSSAKGLPSLRQWGADTVIDYRKQDITLLDQKFDVIFDLSGKLSFFGAKKIMKRDAHFITLMGAPSPKNMILGLLGGLFSTRSFRLLIAPATKSVLDELASLAKDGLSVHIGDRFPLAEVRSAYEAIEARGTIGKAVITLQ